jgi:hypothetical protein
MYKYIIAWCSSSNAANFSSQFFFKVSEFGTVNRSMMSCAVYHVETVKETAKAILFKRFLLVIFKKNINQWYRLDLILFLQKIK